MPDTDGGEAAPDVEAMADDARGDDTFRPHSIDARFRRRVRDDHAPNAALHAALRTAVDPHDGPITAVNLMASHAPGEKPHGPRYHVGVTIENSGAGEPSTGPTVLQELIDRDDVKVIKAHGGARFGDVTVDDDVADGLADAVDETIRQSVDRLFVNVRPIEVRVEPIDVPYDDLPDDVVREAEVAHVLSSVADEFDDHADDAVDVGGGQSTTTTVWSQAADRIRELAREYNDGFDVWDGPDDDRTDDDVADPDDVEDPFAFHHSDTSAVADPDDYDVISGNLTIETNFPDDPPIVTGDVKADRDVDDYVDLSDYNVPNSAEATDVDRHAVGAPWARLRVYADDMSNRDVVRENERFVGLPEGVEVVVEHVEAADGSRIVCGCGDYAVTVPEGTQPPSIDVVCPECGNHFGHGPPTGERLVVDVDHVLSEIRDLRDGLKSRADTYGEDRGADYYHAVRMVDELIDGLAGDEADDGGGDE